MKHGLQDIDWKYVASCLAHEGSDVQSVFFKAFVKECLSWGTHYQIEQQLAWVNGELTKDEKEVLSMITFQTAP